MRVFTTSIGNVANQPTIPATAPAIRDVDQEGPDWDPIGTVWSDDGAGVSTRHVASYCKLNQTLKIIGQLYSLWAYLLSKSKGHTPLHVKL